MPVVCPHPGAVPQGSEYTDDCAGTAAGETCTVSCAAGFTGDSETWTCGIDQEFSGTAPTCAEILTEIEWVPVGDPGNLCDAKSQSCFGSVPYDFMISKYEVTNAQYAEFLNAVAATDTNGLYDPRMDPTAHVSGGLTQSGTPGSHVYQLAVGRENWPVGWVSFWSAARFANWLHNGQPTGAQDNTTTEDGAYTLTPTGIANNTVTRNAGAEAFIPNLDEWYKAAYYDPGAMVYYDYPAGSDTPTACATPGAIPNTANCSFATPFPPGLIAVGSYPAAASPVGTFDQGGNVWEWSENIRNGTQRFRLGGAFFTGSADLSTGFVSGGGGGELPASAFDSVGFRVASEFPGPVTPVPSLSPYGMAMLLGLLLLMGLWRLRARRVYELRSR